MFELTKPVIGNVPRITISKSDYEQTISATKNIYIYSDIEDKFDLLIGNFFDFERELLNTALEDSIYRSYDTETFYEKNRILDRRLNNLLSSSRLYLDQVDKVLKNFNEEIYQKIAEKKKEVYDSSFSYRLIEALRNQMQHREISTIISYSSCLIGPDEDKIFLFYSKILLDVKKFVKDDKIKKSLVKEIENKDMIDLNYHIRMYIENMASIQDKTRELNLSDYKKSKVQIENMISLYSQQYPKIMDEKQKVLSVKDDVEGTQVVFSKNAIENIESLSIKNSSIVNMHKRVVCNISDEQLSKLKN